MCSSFKDPGGQKSIEAVVVFFSCGHSDWIQSGGPVGLSHAPCTNKSIIQTNEVKWAFEGKSCGKCADEIDDLTVFQFSYKVQATLCPADAAWLGGCKGSSQMLSGVIIAGREWQKCGGSSQLRNIYIYINIKVLLNL